MTVSIARKNLFEGRVRFILSVGGITLAMLLILVLDAIFAGAANEVTAYMDNTSFDVVVAQEGVRNLHMSSSFFPATKINEVERIEGVARVDSILYTSSYLVSGNERSVAYIIGYHPGKIGGPWTMAKGTPRIKRGEIIVDEQVAGDYALQIGDRITALGRVFRIGGLTQDTQSITNSIAFIRFDDFERLRGLRQVASFALINIEKGQSPVIVRDRIRASVEGVTPQTKEGFVASERRIVSDMSIDIMRLMNLIGFLVGLAAVALTVYTATLFKVREYGVLKALGAKNRRLIGIVLEQAVISIVIAFVAAMGLTLAMMAGLRLAQSNISLAVGLPSILKVVTGAGVIGVLSAAIPILRIARLDPAAVFRR